MKVPGSNSKSSLWKSAALGVAVLLVAWLVYFGLLLAELSPYRPSTLLGWAALFILGVPACFLVQAFVEGGVEWLSRRFRGKNRG